MELGVWAQLEDAAVAVAQLLIARSLIRCRTGMSIKKSVKD